MNITLENISVSFGGKKILTDISLPVCSGESIVILGTSGIGKSVLLKTIIGLVKPSSGNVYIDGCNIHTASIKEKFISVINHMGYLFQGCALFDSMNIAENICFFAKRYYSLNKAQEIKLAEEYLHKVGLDANIHSLYPNELSGGMQKRVGFARAICTKPKLLFLDEPTTGLDPKTAKDISILIHDLQQELKATSITITHDYECAKILGGKIMLLKDGALQENMIL